MAEPAKTHFSKEERVRLDFFVARTIGAPRATAWGDTGGEAMWELYEMLQNDLGRYEIGTAHGGVREMIRAFILAAPEDELITLLGLLPFACAAATENAKSRFITVPSPSKVASAVNEYLEAIGHPARFIGTNFVRAPVAELEPPELAYTSDTVQAALRDWRRLRHTSGAPAALDRLHTAFHGYLKAICDGNDIEYEENADVTKLYKAIREKHPALQTVVPRAYDITLMLDRLAAVVTGLNPIRNNATLAHPNEQLLPEPEAVLVGNCIHTLFHYLNSRCEAKGQC